MESARIRFTYMKRKREREGFGNVAKGISFSFTPPATTYSAFTPPATTYFGLTPPATTYLAFTPPAITNLVFTPPATTAFLRLLSFIYRGCFVLAIELPFGLVSSRCIGKQ